MVGAYIWNAFSGWLGQVECALPGVLEDELDKELANELDDELTDELDEETGKDELEEVACVDEVDPPAHILPFIVGCSASPPFFSPCKPKLTDWPGAMLPFHAMLVAV